MTANLSAEAIPFVDNEGERECNNTFECEEKTPCGRESDWMERAPRLATPFALCTSVSIMLYFENTVMLCLVQHINI